MLIWPSKFFLFFKWQTTKKVLDKLRNKQTKEQNPPWCLPHQFLGQRWCEHHSLFLWRWSCPQCWWCRPSERLSPYSSAEPTDCLQSLLNTHTHQSSDTCLFSKTQYTASHTDTRANLTDWWKSTHHLGRLVCFGPGNHWPAPPWQEVQSVLPVPDESKQETEPAGTSYYILIIHDDKCDKVKKTFYLSYLIIVFNYFIVFTLKSTYDLIRLFCS